MSLEALCKLLGDEVASRHEPVAVEGLELEATLAPRDAGELSRALAALNEHALPVLVRGGGTRMGLGNPPREARVLLSTARLAGIEEFDAVDGVVRVRAGTPLAEVAKTVEASGWELPLDPPGAGSTVGGAVASSAIGPRCQRFGPPKNALLGLDVVLATGEHTSCGARVVKNVTGYDMAKLYAGSFGSLGVIESAWLRVRPRPRLVKTAVAALDAGDCARALRVGLAAARRDSARVAAVVTGELASQLGAPPAEGGAAALVVEYGGDEPAVERDLEAVLAEAGGREVPEASRIVGRLRDLQATGAVRARIAALPTRLAPIVEALARAGVATLTYPGVGVVYAIAPDDEAQIRAIDAAAGDAALVIEALPLARRRERDVFGPAGPAARIARALKQRFDPAGILNPGRFQGRL